MIVAFFEMKAGDEMALDDSIKADINAVRAALSRSGFKTKFAAVLLSDTSILQAPELEERMSSIRRVTSLDAKTGLFFMPPMSSQAEIGTWVQGLLTTVQPLCVEYYRDLTKHARRKKARGSIPTPTAMPGRGAAQALSTPGWNCRYEVKQGAFAEFRQEMDVAERHYAQAIEDLFSSEGIFETTPSWSPRWGEARLLCDALALRVIRCQLWNGSTSGAVQSWSNYKARMKDLVDRRGKGSQTYSWEAWESRWAKVMAELTQRADFPAFRVLNKPAADESVELTIPRIYASPEKSYPTAERLPPWRMLHHAGYWLRLAAKSSRARWTRALNIPDEDRVPPGQSPASAVANRNRVYDHYLVPEPHEELPLQGKQGFNHLMVIGTLTDQTVSEFTGRGQLRLSEHTSFEHAQDLAQAERYEEALKILVPLYEEASWRADHWHDFLGELLFLVHRCSQEVKDAEHLLASTWELLSGEFGLKPDVKVDLAHCLDDLRDDNRPRVSIECQDRDRVSPVTARFSFAERQGFVGEPLKCQLALSSSAPANVASISLSKVTIEVASLKTLEISHEAEGEAPPNEDLQLEEVAEALLASANLTLQSGETRVFDFALTFRAAQDVELQQVSISIAADSFDLRHRFCDHRLLGCGWWYTQRDGQLWPTNLHCESSTTVTVLPKPPKLDMKLHGLRKQYYVGEQIRLQVDVVNNEADTVNGSITQKVVAADGTLLPSRWGDSERDCSSKEAQADVEELSTSTLDALAPATTQMLNLHIDSPGNPTAHSLVINADYTLASEKFTPLKKTLTVELAYGALFEPKFNFGPLLHPAPWPSYFDATAEETERAPAGILQLWRLGCQFTSLAAEDVVITKAEVIQDHVDNDAMFEVIEAKHTETQQLASHARIGRSFEVETRKYSLDDRRPTVLELSLAVSWSREKGSAPCVTKLPMPRLTIPSSEPRALCTMKHENEPGTDVILQYHLENPSAHFLTFAVTMGASEDFAFSGPKHRALSLAPLSRHRVEYRLMVHDTVEESKQGDSTGRWIWPALSVVDSYYQKTLRVQAAGPGVKADQQRGLGIWVPSHST